ncbi:MAG TPA: hypothetical protein VGI30_07640 [Caulobacteraceae bacterium]|jgi:hypothetical protein
MKSSWLGAAHPVPKQSGSVDRFANLSRPVAAVILLLLAALIVLGLALPTEFPIANPARGGGDNVRFYAQVIDRVRRGQPYPAAAVAELRAEHSAVRPFVVVRPPLLATAMARLPNVATADVILAVLAVATAFAWAYRLIDAGSGPVWLAGLALILFTGLAVPMNGHGTSLLHEAWAGVLIALSLATRTDRRFTLSVALGLLAALIRELAMPYLLVMAVMAFRERRRAEALAFTLALAATLVALAWHAHTVTALVTSHDLPSAGWVKFGGWSNVLRSDRWNLLVAAFGIWAAAFIAPLALLGAVSRKDGLGERLAALLGGYAVGFMVVGRPENAPWGLVTTPLVAVGLCLAIPALAALWRSALNTNSRPV